MGHLESLPDETMYLVHTSSMFCGVVCVARPAWAGVVSLTLQMPADPPERCPFEANEVRPPDPPPVLELGLVFP